MTTEVAEKAEWAQADTAQWHRVRDAGRDRQFICGVPFTRLNKAPLAVPETTDYMPACRVCRGMR